MAIRLARLLLKFARREPLLLTLVILLVIVLSLKPSIAYRLPFLVDWGSISVIGSLMLCSRGLELSGFFSNMASHLVSRFQSKPRLLLVLLLVATGFTASIVMNDASLFIYVPLTLAVYPEPPFKWISVVLVDIAANIGSTLTPIGNPQNIIIWRCSGVGFTVFTYWMSLLAIPLMLVLIAYALLLHSHHTYAATRRPPPPRVLVNKRLLYTSIMVLLATIVLAEAGYPIASLPLALLVYALSAKIIVYGLDVPLLATFILMFMVFGAISEILPPPPPWTTHSGLGVLVLGVLLSQAISNVPATIMLVKYTRLWRQLAWGVNVGGVGFIVGSLANIITVRLSGLSLKDYHKYALPYFMVALIYALLLSTIYAH